MTVLPITNYLWICTQHVESVVIYSLTGFKIWIMNVHEKDRHWKIEIYNLYYISNENRYEKRKDIQYNSKYIIN